MSLFPKFKVDSETVATSATSATQPPQSSKSSESSSPAQREVGLVASQEYAVWLCPHCGQPAVIEDVCPSLDGKRTLTLWHCEPCQTWAVTPDTLRKPPTGWVKKTEQ